MEELVDWTHATNSPEEVAIHFLQRHAECRRALIGLAGDQCLPNHARNQVPPDSPVAANAVGNSLPPEAPRPNGNVPAGKVTENGSCADRFSRAYAAARHKSASARTSRSVQKTA